MRLFASARHDGCPARRAFPCWGSNAFALFLIAFAFVGSFSRRIAAYECEVSLDTRGGYNYITSNGIPDHDPGRFPNAHNPNSIRPQSYNFRIPVTPRDSSRPIPEMPNLFGVAINGVPLDPGTAEFWNRDPRSGWNYEANTGHLDLGLDWSNAHVQPTGAYHYHGVPLGILKTLPGDQMNFIGFAADGYPIYALQGYDDAMDASSPLRILHSSYQLRDGQRPSGASGPGGTYDGTFTQDFIYVKGSGDLDECNGRFGVTPEAPEGIYYYVLTNEFPCIPRYWHGIPDDSFLKQPMLGGPGGGRRGGPGQMGGPMGGPMDQGGGADGIAGPPPGGGGPPMGGDLSQGGPPSGMPPQQHDFGRPPQ